MSQEGGSGGASARAVAAAALLLLPAAVRGQAWIAPKGEGTITFAYQNNEFTGHFSSTGERLDIGGSHSQAVLLDAEYSFSDRFAAAVGIPYVWARNGKDPSPTNAPIDDGKYHDTLQDFRFHLRYNVLRDPIVLTPFIGSVIPSHHYNVVGEAAPGRDLRELSVGFHAGRLLQPSLPNTYVQATVAYTFVEHLLGVSTDRLNAILEVGQFLTERMSLQAFGSFQETFGGIKFDLYDFSAHPEIFEQHDRFLDDDNWKVGFGANYAISRSVLVFVNGFYTVAGRDTHQGHGFTIGVSYAFHSASRSH